MTLLSQRVCRVALHGRLYSGLGSGGSSPEHPTLTFRHPLHQVMTALTSENAFGYSTSLAPAPVVKVAERVGILASPTFMNLPGSHCLGLSFFEMVVFSCLMPIAVVMLLKALDLKELPL